jgi:hypothetical protein
MVGAAFRGLRTPVAASTSRVDVVLIAYSSLLVCSSSRWTCRSSIESRGFCADRTLAMDLKGGSQSLSNLYILWNNYKRSYSRSTRVWSCPKCPDRVFHLEDELFTHAAQHRPEFANGFKGDAEIVRFRVWLERAAQQNEQ